MKQFLNDRKVKVVTGIFMIALFCGTLMFSPNIVRAQQAEDEDEQVEQQGERKLRKGYCWLDKNENICRKKKSGNECAIEKHCSIKSYAKGVSAVISVVSLVDKITK